MFFEWNEMNNENFQTMNSPNYNTDNMGWDNLRGKINNRSYKQIELGILQISN